MGTIWEANQLEEARCSECGKSNVVLYHIPAHYLDDQELICEKCARLLEEE